MTEVKWPLHLGAWVSVEVPGGREKIREEPRPGERKMTGAQAGREGIVRTGRRARVLTASRFADSGIHNSNPDFEP